MGKSRLLYEFHHRLREQHPSVTYVEGQCMSYGQATPYLPVRTILRQLCGLTSGDGLEVITAKVHQCLQAVELAAPAGAPYLLHLLEVEGDMDVLARQTPHTIKARTFEALQQVWADAYGDWFPSHPYRTVAAPEILAVHERSDDGDAGRAELWLAVERES